MSVTAFNRRRRELAAALAKEKEKQDEQTVEKPLDEMTVAELKEYADQHGIDLGEAKKKAEILAAIQAAVSGGDPSDKNAQGGGDHAGE
jgi:hypothetical protein